MGEEKKEQLKITWLGQGGFLLEADGIRLVIDPYLSNALSARGLERMIPVPVSIRDLRPHIVCCTHDHADHFDEQTIIPLVKEWPDCRFVAPTSVREHYRKLNLSMEQFTTLDCGGKYVSGSLSIRAVPAYHTDKYAVGLIIEFGGQRIYLSGDTELEESLVPAIREVAGGVPDIVIICINGKLGNMTDQQAEQVVAALKPRIVIPMHYGLFAENTVDPLPFAKAIEAMGRKCVLMKPGEPVGF